MMSVVTRPFAGFSKTLSNDRIDPNNFVCLRDADRVREEERSVSAQAPLAAVEHVSLSDDAWSGLEVGQTLGQLISAARKSRSLSREQVAEQTCIPSYYIRMIESDCYDAVPDQLYLLPFFERYANFLGLDAHRVVSRFIRDFEKAEAAPVEAPPAHAPARVATTIPQNWRRIAEAAVIVGILLPFVGWEVGTIRAAHHRQADTSSVAAVSSVTPPTPVIAPNEAPASPVVQAPVQTPDTATTTAQSSAPPQAAPATVTPIRRRRHGRSSHLVNHHSRHLRRGIS
ncbi:MAG TPA: helix-turn-helix domain-containing protein [Patescibacteria group bacterium]|nr:helix-turn-helix domain-containing protein [Patescibacteria group bacterium]